MGSTASAFLPVCRSSGSSRAKPNQAGNFTATFTGEVPGCPDEVTFGARAQGPDGELTIERDADQPTVAIAIAMFESKVTIDIEAGNDFLDSESTGLFFIDPDFNRVIGFGTGSTHWEVPDFPRIVISEAGVEKRTQLFTGNGTYQVMPTGQLASGDVRSSGTVNFIPRGYVSSITVSYSDPGCFPEGPSTTDPWGQPSSASPPSTRTSSPGYRPTEGSRGRSPPTGAAPRAPGRSQSRPVRSPLRYGLAGPATEPGVTRVGRVRRDESISRRWPTSSGILTMGVVVGPAPAAGGVFSIPPPAQSPQSSASSI